MNVRAMFIDMDGTLLTTSNIISHRNKEAIDQVINKGIKVFLATGRHYEVTAPYHKELGLQTPMICLNGASIHDASTGKPIQMRPIKLDEERFHRLTSEISSNILVHSIAGLYCKKVNTEIASWTKEGKIPPIYVGDLRLANYPDVLKYSIRTGSPCPKLSAMFTDEADVIDWDDGFEIIAPGVSKWSAIQTLLRVFGMSAQEIVTIGDGPNDLQMLRHAGTGVAMANASNKVKAAADFVTGDHENDGLAEFIERNLIQSFVI